MGNILPQKKSSGKTTDFSSHRPKIFKEMQNFSVKKAATEFCGRLRGTHRWEEKKVQGVKIRSE